MATGTPEIDRSTYDRIQTWSLSTGIGLVFLGLFTSAFALFTTFLTIILLGVVLVIRGAGDITTVFMPHHKKGFAWNLFGGILSVAIGILMIFRPGVTAATLTYLLAAFLVVLGLFKLIAAPIEHDANWGWMMLSGIVSLIFGIWIIGMWPTVSFWLIGLLIGIEILVQGIVMIVLPYSIPRTSRKSSGELFAH
jgi:uncharacterized membrane protein HdeD (DUF308 family)